jgi:hypothetical protein
MAIKRKKTDVVYLQVRLREYVRSRLAVEAKRNEVSLNAEIVKRLEASLEKDERDAMAMSIHHMGDKLGALTDLLDKSGLLKQGGLL